MKQSLHPDAFARIHGGSQNPQIKGTVKFLQREDGLVVEVEAAGLPSSRTGFFGFHIHETGNCAGDGFPNTGAHFNPGNAQHPNHAGDLPPLLSDHGKAYMKVFTDRLTLVEIIGKSVIIHSEPDDFHTQPSGNAGKKIACGIIQRTKKRDMPIWK